MALIREYEQGQDGMEMAQTPECEQKKTSTLKPGVMTDRPVFGPLIRPYPAIHGPINESGVIYMFGTVSEKLGFAVMLIQTGFPDCLALRLVDDDRWQLVRIEFLNTRAATLCGICMIRASATLLFAGNITGRSVRWK
jgi:hypothetical protein